MERISAPGGLAPPQQGMSQLSLSLTESGLDLIITCCDNEESPPPNYPSIQAMCVLDGTVPRCFRRSAPTVMSCMLDGTVPCCRWETVLVFVAYALVTSLVALGASRQLGALAGAMQGLMTLMVR